MKKELEQKLVQHWPSWFNVTGDQRAIQKRIETAQLESLRTCEVCGKPGKRREGDCIRTVCDDHAGL
jgi:hypothetical protein